MAKVALRYSVAVPDGSLPASLMVGLGALAGSTSWGSRDWEGRLGPDGWRDPIAPLGPKPIHRHRPDCDRWIGRLAPDSLTAVITSCRMRGMRVAPCGPHAEPLPRP